MHMEFEETPDKGILFDERFTFEWNTDRLAKHQIVILLKNRLFYDKLQSLMDVMMTAFSMLDRATIYGTDLVHVGYKLKLPRRTRTPIEKDVINILMLDRDTI